LNAFNLNFDLIFSNMALHWSIDLREMLQLLYQVTSFNGFVAFSIPLNQTFNELPQYSRNVLDTREKIEKILMNLRFEKIDITESLITIAFDSQLNALKSIKAVGANLIFNQPIKTLRGKSFFKNFSNHLTYHIGYFILRKSYVS
jgi:malonyl-CoA O-methyltransferase